MNKILSCFFWTKVSFSIIVVLGILSFFAIRISDLHSKALSDNKLKPKAPPPTIVKSDSTVFDPAPANGMNASSMNASSMNAIAMNRIEPPAGTVLSGFHLNWNVETPIQLTALISKAPAVVNAFIQVDHISSTPYNVALVNWHGQQAQLVGAILELTIEPSSIGQMPDSTIIQIARQCQRINTEYNTPMIIRYGHEMNGNWVTYAYQPSQYIRGFRQMATILRQYTNLTAMMWAPNLGINYPFSTPTNVDPAELLLLDTNGNGVIDVNDDPYGPFFPGAEYVDWVGLSLYWYNEPSVEGNSAPPVDYLVGALTGTTAFASNFGSGRTNVSMCNFYQRFAAAFNKPFAMAETAVPYFASGATGRGRDSELKMKQDWWRQIFSLDFDTFPLFKAFLWFDEAKINDPTVSDIVYDFRLSFNPAIRNAFVQDISAGGFVAAGRGVDTFYLSALNIRVFSNGSLFLANR